MDKSDKNLIKAIELIIKMSEDDYIWLKENILSLKFKKEEIDFIDIKYSEKNLKMKTSIEINKKSIYKLYEEEINRVNKVLNSRELIKKLDGFKLILFGDTGTGKTSVVNQIKKTNKNYKFENINLGTLLSPKLGQTQLNLISLFQRLNIEYKDKKLILFIDELDSLVSNRSNTNDVAEHNRIVASFIKFLDSLNNNIVVFAATNVIDFIDVAVLRRFNISFEGKKFSIKKFYELFNNEVKEENISVRIMNSTFKNIDDKIFTLSDLNSFENEAFIEKEINKKVDLFYLFWKKFNDKLILNGNLSMRTKKRLMI